jgi:hypothetical protein
VSDTDTYTVSFKTQGGYDASLIVVRGNDAPLLAGNIVALTNPVDGDDDSTVIDLVVDTELLLHAAYSLKAPTPATQESRPAPSFAGGGEASAPVGAIKTCAHGKRTRRTGTNARGAWVAHFCPQPKGSADQCAPVWGDD